MFGLGIPELMVIMVIALLIFGPKRLPEVGQNLGKALREFKQGADQIKKDVESSTGLDEESRKELKEAMAVDGIQDDLKEMVSLEEPAKDSSDSKDSSDKEKVKTK